MPFRIIRNDITKVKADAVVNTANPMPVVGRGTDSAVYRAAGEAALLAEREKLGRIAPGSAAATPAFGLRARYILHTVGPRWIDGEHGERETLRACYQSALALAAELNCESAAFPLIASGVYGFPKDEALRIALDEIGAFLLSHEMEVILVVFDRRAVELSEQLVGGIEQYIDEHTAHRLREAEYGGRPSDDRRRESGERSLSAEKRPSDAPEAEKPLPEGALPAAILPDADDRTLDELLGGVEDTFQQRLFRLIDASGMDEVTVYKKANIDRKVFSTIRCRADYRPKKKTALAFAIALKLDLPTTQDLLARAELAFSPSSRFDLIVTYFIQNGVYDIFEINAALFKYGQPTLGE